MCQSALPPTNNTVRMGEGAAADHGDGKRRNATKHSAEKIYTNVKIIRVSAATDFCNDLFTPFAPGRAHFANARRLKGPRRCRALLFAARFVKSFAPKAPAT